MTEFNHTHATIFDELIRQCVDGVDIAKLTNAVLTAKALIAAPGFDAHPRCAAGSCDE